MCYGTENNIDLAGLQKYKHHFFYFILNISLSKDAMTSLALSTQYPFLSASFITELGAGGGGGLFCLFPVATPPPNGSGKGDLISSS